MKQSKIIIAITALITLSTAQSSAYFNIVNNSGLVAEIYLSSPIYSAISPKSGGNLAYDILGNLSEAATRTLQPGEATTYNWYDARMGLCLDKINVKFAGQTAFTPAKKTNEIRKGCPIPPGGLEISITQVDGKPQAQMVDLPPAQ